MINISKGAKCCLTCRFYQRLDELVGICDNPDSYDYDWETEVNDTCPYWEEINHEQSFVYDASVQDS